MRKNKVETAAYLAEAHRRVEPSLERIYLLTSENEDDPREPIKLLEIVKGSLASNVMPVSFAPDPVHGIDYPSFIVELSPQAFREHGMKQGETISFRGRTWKIGLELAPTLTGA